MHFQIGLKLTNIVVIVVSYCGINEVFLNILCNSVICIKVFYNSYSSTFVRSTFISTLLIIRGESIDERIPTKTDWHPTLKRHRASPVSSRTRLLHFHFLAFRKRFYRETTHPAEHPRLTSVETFIPVCWPDLASFPLQVSRILPICGNT